MERLMTETTKAPSKEAMEAVRGVRCPHEPVNCDYCVAAALEAFVAPVAKNLVELTSAHVTAVIDRDALRERNRALVEALGNLRHDRNPDCWCGVSIGDPNYGGVHSGACDAARAALAADAKAGEDR